VHAKYRYVITGNIKDDFDLTSTQKDGTNQRSTYENKNRLTNETMHLLEPYIRQII